MTTTHRTRAGGWAVCPAPERCRLRFHFPDMTPEAMALVPERVLWDMCGIVEPPTHTNARGELFWQDRKGETHRDYDLPAAFRIDRVEWRRHGQWHRGGDQPAILFGDGSREWYQHGRRFRRGGQPVWVDAAGTAVPLTEGAWAEAVKSVRRRSWRFFVRFAIQPLLGGHR